MIRRDEINVAYILRILANYSIARLEEKEKINKRISELLAGDVELRSKRELILELIDKNLPEASGEENITDGFDVFWSNKRKEFFENLCCEENILQGKVSEITGEYLFTERKPLSDTIISLLETKPKILERRPIAERITRSHLKNSLINFTNGAT